MGRNHLSLTKTEQLQILMSPSSGEVPNLTLSGVELLYSRVVHNLGVFLDSLFQLELLLVLSPRRPLPRSISALVASFLGLGSPSDGGSCPNHLKGQLLHCVIYMGLPLKFSWRFQLVQKTAVKAIVFSHLYSIWFNYIIFYFLYYVVSHIEAILELGNT